MRFHSEDHGSYPKQHANALVHGKHIAALKEPKKGVVSRLFAALGLPIFVPDPDLSAGAVVDLETL